MDSRVMMDTKFWIYLKHNPEKLTEFQEKANENDVAVLFSSGNFIDLVKAHEQDRLSKIITEIADLYIPLQSREGHYYDYSEDPVSLIPTPDERQDYRRITRVLDDDLTLRYIFRTANWEPPQVFLDMTENMKEIYNKYGFDNSMGYIFEEYLEDDGEKLLLQQENIEPVDFIRGMLELHRIEQMKETENPDSNDFADMVICSHAMLTECDRFFVEEKWINQNIIKNVVERLTLDEPVLYQEYDNFIDEFHIGSKNSQP